MSDAETLERVRSVQANINYLLPGPDINRRFVSAGVEVNTGSYGPHEVTVRDGRAIRDEFTLDRNGFVLLDHKSAVHDFQDKEEVERVYPDEVTAAVMAATGASFVAPLGWMNRTSGHIEPVKATAGYTHRGGLQPPAGEAHVDTEPSRMPAMSQSLYAKLRPDGPGFKRFIYMSFWKTFSEPPQDWPLALCDGRSVRDDEGLPNTLVVCDKIPEGEAMFAPDPEEGRKPAAAIFRYSPDHEWWYFSNMTRDETLLFKFHDSDHRGAWRCPHTAFHDPSFVDAKPRASIEFRVVAFFE